MAEEKNYSVTRDGRLEVDVKALLRSEKVQKDLSTLRAKLAEEAARTQNGQSVPSNR